ncbi:MAG: hypothetical protein ACREDQ_08790, partial [Limisphaerales bacterium]
MEVGHVFLERPGVANIDGMARQGIRKGTVPLEGFRAEHLLKHRPGLRLAGRGHALRQFVHA